ncbi:uncharacterized protein LOC129753907 [Uranotaenia lowii]|uniref:uncharacterized protein LOC129753907 n=1 Tax=Uranotaenia lowii TaxID=190385 RepID=UPI00247A19C6|nr:uncharacterized protein LOC129753907 [Uranotaenia lowii]
MADAKPMSIPADPSVRLGKSMGPNGPEEEAEMKKVPFKEAVGSLSFAPQVTRPDISFAVNAVSQFGSNPGRQHWEAVKKIIRYLKGTTTNKLEYSKRGSSELVGFSDADWGGDPDNRRSTTGYVFTMQGGAVSWNVKKQLTVALSSCEAEYMIFEEEPVLIYCDNQGAINIAGNGAYNPRTKHVSIRYHFVHESLKEGAVKVKYIPTTDQPADGFTKLLAIQKQQRFCGLVGVTN